MGNESQLGKKLRENIQANIDRAAADRKRELFKRRIDLARSGLEKFRAKKVGEAVTAFHTYIMVLEEWKNVKPGGLTPTLFERDKDIHELLLISGVYWDLAKLYDRTKSAEKVRDFHHYLNQFVAFSKGMPYEPLCAETLRKYMACHQPVHAKEFRDAYFRITGSKCYVATALADVTDFATLERLREFRDGRLQNHRAGRVFTRLYYRYGSILAAVTDRLPQGLRKILGALLDRFARFAE